MSREILNNPDFAVVAEGDGYVVVDKPAPLLVHPSTPGNPTTLFDGLQGLFAYELANGGQISIINRLDRETSGLVLVATTKDRARQFSMAMQNRQISKRYQALVYGWPEWPSNQIEVDAPILRKGEVEPSEIWVRQFVHPNGAKSQTALRVLERLGGKISFSGRQSKKFSVVEAKPHTGRMHQIRVHLEHLGHPVIGDKIYGPEGGDCYLEFIETGWTPSLQRRLLLPRQALHSSAMGVDLGAGSGEKLEWEVPMPSQLITMLMDE